MSEAHTWKVHYFGGYGRGEALRMCLWLAKQEYEDVAYTFESLKQAKESGILEFGQLPVVECDGKFYSQSQAMLRSMGMMFGFYPEDALQAWKVDSTLDFIGDLLGAFYKAKFNPDAEAGKQLMADFQAKTFPHFLQCIQKRLEQNSSPDHIVGEKHTIADIALAAVAYSSFLNEHNPTRAEQLAIVEQYPKVLDYFKQLGEVFKEYLTARKPSPW